MYPTSQQIELVKKALEKREVNATEEVMECMKHFVIITVASKDDLLEFFPEGKTINLGEMMINHLLEKEVIEKTSTCYELNSTFKEEIEVEEKEISE